ncbi:MAG: glycosyltransferase family 8 protein [Aphanocapsa sp. GSE-SYN-MK-11-07L]|jgi:lipopolysaccharide biosynthesis glycosyltransferase|nr:glycosyltransferase family 8 protein [Aphanocapsa sp. GSE-SYN-MK-11-07L]
MSFVSTENSVQVQKSESDHERNPIFIVCAADNNYAMPLAVTMRSVIENLKADRKIIFFVIDGGITTFNQQKILKSLPNRQCDVQFLQISDALVKLIREAHELPESSDLGIKSDYVSIASFYRLLISDILPPEIEKVIYLDCDLIVEGDLEQLWQVNLDENYLLAVRDTWIPNVSCPTAKLNYEQLGIAPGSKYFNAGVLVLNLKKWRANQMSPKALQYFKQNLPYIGWYDQGLLNALLVGQWGELDPRWNFNATSFYDYASENYLPWHESKSMFSEETYNNLVRHPFILHYVSVKKPWTSRHTPRKDLFFKYIDMTLWSGWRLTIWRRLWRRLVREFKTAMRR